MRIVVLGAGTVGRSIASLLCMNRQSVTVVDVDADCIRQINETLDVKAITGSASQSSVLFQAGVSSCDLCLAVTGEDEVNLVSASMAKAMGARRTIARVYAQVFRDLSTFDYQRHFKIDRLLSLEHLSAMALARGIRNPGSVVVENLARGEIEVHEVIVSTDAKAVGKQIKGLGVPKSVRIGSITRDRKTRIAGAEDRIELDDRLTLIGRAEEVDAVKDLLRGEAPARIGVVIAGGGETGFHLARTLEGQRFTVLLMESDRSRCELLASKLNLATVVNCDATRRATLEEERVGSADVFVACTGDDENNIMSAVEAKDIGAKSILAIVSRPDYAHVVGKLGIDLAVSPREVMAREVMGYLNTGSIVSRSSLGDGGISVLEMEVSSDAPATEHVLANLPLPTQCLIAAVMRENESFVPGADDRLKGGDAAVVLVNDSAIEDVVRVMGGSAA